MKYTESELDSLAIQDLLNDAKHAQEQAQAGEFYPDKGVTKESLLKYAQECLDTVEKYKHGGAHIAVIKGL